MSVDVPLNNIRIKEFPTINLAGGVDFDLDEIRIKELAPIKIGITELPDINLNAKLDPVKLTTDSKLVTDNKLTTDNKLQTDNKLLTDNKVVTDSKLQTDNKVDLDLDVRIKELPQIDLQFGLRPMRFHFPINYQFCLKLFGCKVFEFKTCGEGMFIAEDYQAKSTEKCD